MNFKLKQLTTFVFIALYGINCTAATIKQLSNKEHAANHHQTEYKHKAVKQKKHLITIKNSGDDKIVSNAFNYTKNATVNPRTGTLNYSIPIVNIPQKNGLSSPLSITYNQSSTINLDGLGKKWNFTISRIITDGSDGYAYLADGSIYKIRGDDTLRYFKLKNIVINTRDNNYHQQDADGYFGAVSTSSVTYLSGTNRNDFKRKEYFDGNGRLIGIVNEQANSVNYYYDSSGNLAEIIDSFNNKTTFDYEYFQVNITIPNGNIIKLTLDQDFGGNISKQSVIYNDGTKDKTLTTALTYTEQVDTDAAPIFLDNYLIKSINYPNDLIVTVDSYTTIQQNAGSSTIPVVAQLSTSSPTEPRQAIKYLYEQGADKHNFTGYPYYSQGQDALYGLSPTQDYNYTNISTIGDVKTETTYDRFHDMVKSQTYIKEDNAYKLYSEKDMSYPVYNITSWKSSFNKERPKDDYAPPYYNYDNLPANYQMPMRTISKVFDSAETVAVVAHMTTSTATYNDYAEPVNKISYGDQIAKINPYDKLPTTFIPIQSQITKYDPSSGVPVLTTKSGSTNITISKINLKKLTNKNNDQFDVIDSSQSGYETPQSDGLSVSSPHWVSTTTNKYQLDTSDPFFAYVTSQTSTSDDVSLNNPDFSTINAGVSYDVDQNQHTLNTTTKETVSSGIVNNNGKFLTVNNSIEVGKQSISSTTTGLVKQNIQGLTPKSLLKQTVIGAPPAHVINTTYDGLNHKTGVTYSDGKNVKYKYHYLQTDGENALFKIYPNNYQVKENINSFGQVVSIYDNTDGKGMINTNPNIFSNFLGSTKYDDLGRKASTTDATGLITTYSYDQLNRAITTSTPGYNGKLITSYTIYDDAESQGIKYTKGSDGSIISYAVTRTIDDPTKFLNLPAGIVNEQQSYIVESKYVNPNNIINSINTAIANKNYYRMSSIDKDVLKRKVKVTDIDGYATKYNYSLANSKLVTMITKSNGSKIIYTYDAYGNKLTDTIEGIDPSTHQSIIHQIDERHYNELGQLTRLILNPKGTPKREMDYSYDQYGNATKMIDNKGTTFITTFNEFNMPVTKSYQIQGGEKTIYNKYIYDPITLLTSSIIDPSTGKEIDYKYDDQSQLIKKTISSLGSNDEHVIQYKYDKKKRLRSVTDIYNNITSYEYNNGLLANVHYQAHDSTQAIKLAQYNYDNLNRMSSIDYYNNQGDENRYKVFTYKDDQIGQLQSLTEYTGSSQGDHKLESKVSYTYNIDGNIQSQTIVDELSKSSVVDTYKYNTIKQLTEDAQQATDKALMTTAYIYDADGNIYSRSIKNNLGTETKTYINDGLDQLTTIKSSDVKGNQESISLMYDDSGNLKLDERGDILSYNPLNQLTIFKAPTGKETNYSYYPNNLLAYQSEKNIPESQNVDIFYNDAKYAQTLNEVYEANSIYPSHKTSYIYGGVERLARQVDVNPVLQSYISNAKGDVLKVSNNTTVKRGVDYQYSAYGKPAKQPKSEEQIVRNQFMYSGERYDASTGLQYLRARFYSPELMRFINQDSTDLLNRFAYASGDPIMNVDPSGALSVSHLITGVAALGAAVIRLRSGDLLGAVIDAGLAGSEMGLGFTEKKSDWASAVLVLAGLAVEVRAGIYDASKFNAVDLLPRQAEQWTIQGSNDTFDAAMWDNRLTEEPDMKKECPLCLDEFKVGERVHVEQVQGKPMHAVHSKGFLGYARTSDEPTKSLGTRRVLTPYGERTKLRWIDKVRWRFSGRVRPGYKVVRSTAQAFTVEMYLVKTSVRVAVHAIVSTPKVIWFSVPSIVAWAEG